MNKPNSPFALGVVVCALLSLANRLQADPLDQWTVRDVLPLAANLHGITYGNDQYVAVGDVGTVLTSSDGIAWVKRVSGTAQSLHGVAFGENQFVAVGDTGTIITSPDGITWTCRHSSTKVVPFLRAVAYGNNRFVAVGSGSVVFTSPDGISWAYQDPPGIWSELAGIVFANDLFVAVGDGAIEPETQFRAMILTSPDGVVWTRRFAKGDCDLYGIAYGNSRFMAVGVGYNDGAGYSVMVSSSDGITWASSTWADETNPSLSAVAFGHDQFVAVGFTGGRVRTSPDGTAWTSHGAGTQAWLQGIAHGKNGFVGVGERGTIVTSPDGTTWTVQASATEIRFAGIAYGGNHFVAVGHAWDGQAPFGTIVSSTDGVGWNRSTVAVGETLTSVAHGDNLFVTVGHNLDCFWQSIGPGPILTSSDGVSWTERDTGTPGHFRGVAYGEHQFVAVGAKATNLGEGLILTSPDGMTWTSRGSGLSDPLVAVAYGGSQFVAIAQQAYTEVFTSWQVPSWTVTSPDGITWTEHRSQTHLGLACIAYGRDQFIAGTDSGIILTSPDGITWTPRTSTPSRISSVGYFNNIYVAVGGEGTIMTSPDGLTWISRNSATYGLDLAGIAYGIQTLVAVGSPNVILQSGVIEGMPLVLGPVRLFSGGTAFVSINGLAGQTCSIQASTNLFDWLTITNVTLTDTTGHFTDPSSSDLRQRFYRAVVQ